jgi:hypothetical protein
VVTVGGSHWEQDAMTEKLESCSAVHLPRDPVCSGVDTLGPAVVVRQGEAGAQCGAVEFDAVAEAG